MATAGRYLCPHCGTPNKADARRCKGCGEQIPPGGGVRETLFELDQPATTSWYWNVFFLTLGALVVVQVLMGLLLGPRALGKLVAPGTVLTVLVLGFGAVVYFSAGLLAGRLSTEFTFKESASGGLAAAIIGWVLEAFLFRNTVLGPAVLAGVAAGWAILCALGASAGETLQQRAQKRKREQIRSQQFKA